MPTTQSGETMTPNLNLVKPGYDDHYDVDKFNHNAEIIDSKFVSIYDDATVTGSVINVNDSIDGCVKEIEIFGESKQDTTNGVQLVDFSNPANMSSGITNWSFSNDILEIQGSSGRYVYLYYRITKFVKNNPGKTICFNCEKFENIGNGQGTVVQLNIKYSDGTNQSYKGIYHRGGTKDSYTIPDDTSNISSVELGFYTNNSSTAEEGHIKITKPLIYFGELNNPPVYEPFTGGQPSPNLNYPQEIDVVKGVTNLFNKDNISWYRNNNSTFISDSQNSTTRIRTDAFEIEGGKTYIISGYPSNVTFTSIRCYDEEQNYIENASTKTGDIFSLNENVKYIHLLFGGNNFDDSTNELMKNADIQIEEGSIANTYVPYGTWLPVKSTGKNLFDGKLVSGMYNTTTGNTSTNANMMRNENPVRVTPNEKYIFSNNGIGIGMNIFEYDENFNFLNYYNGASFPANNYFQVSEKTHYINFFRSNSSIDKMQLNKGEKILPYEPYKGAVVPINLNKPNLFDKSLFETFTSSLKYIELTLKPNTIYTMYSNIPMLPSDLVYNLFFYTKGGSANSLINGVTENHPISAMSDSEGKLVVAYRDFNGDLTNEANNYYYQIYEGYDSYYSLAKLGDIQDRLYLENGHAYIEKNIGEYIFTGDEAISTSANSIVDNTFLYQVQNNLFGTQPNNTTNYIMNIFTPNSTGYNNSNIGSYFFNNELRMRVGTDITESADVTLFKQWLKEQYNLGTPVIIYYILDNPQIIDLGEVTMPATFYPTTRMYVIDNLEPEMNVTYYQDFRVLIKNLQEQIAALTAQNSSVEEE